MSFKVEADGRQLSDNRDLERDSLHHRPIAMVRLGEIEVALLDGCLALIDALGDGVEI